LLEDQKLVEGVKRLTDAQTALRNQDPSGVLSSCHKVLESAAKFHADGDLKSGYERLLSRAFPDQPAKYTQLNALIKALTSYTHLARHEQYPSMEITRPETEFVLATTVSLFSLISCRIAKN
jgi:hypothetical protein